MKASTQPLIHRLVAHRGYSQCYPENTLIALREALRAGAQHVEFDVQFTTDGVPVVFHDDELKRITGVSGNILQLTAAELAPLHACESERFGQRFADEPIPTLDDVLRLLTQWPQATAFVEIKSETIDRFGAAAVAQKMVDALAAHQHNCILISFDTVVLQAARNAGMRRIAWVVSKWNDANYEQAKQLAPDLLFCNYKKIPKDAELWSGVWQWALYDVVETEVALHWFSRGVALIETWDVGALLNDSRLQVAEQPAGKTRGE